MIPKIDIKSIGVLADPELVLDGEYQPNGPFTTRYIFTTNALPILKGEHYAKLNILGPEVHFAVSNNFNIGIICIIPT